MYIIIGIIYIAFIMVTMYLVVRDRKCLKATKEENGRTPVSSGDKKLAIIILICTFFLYYIIGYLLKTDMLNAFTWRKNGVSISFIGIVLLFVTSISVGNIIDVIRKKIERRKNQ